MQSSNPQARARRIPSAASRRHNVEFGVFLLIEYARGTAALPEHFPDRPQRPLGPLRGSSLFIRCLLLFTMPDLPLHFWYVTSSCGGASVTLPLTVAIALWLAVGYSSRLALGWLALIAGAASIVLVTKLAFLGWGIGVRDWDFTGVSGHAMMSTAIYPVAFFLILLPTRPSIRVAGIVAGFCVGIVISFSRIVVEAHSPSEAVVGCVMGAVIALLFLRLARHTTQSHNPLSILPVMMSLVVLVAAFHHIHIPTHRWVEHVAMKISGHTRPFVRARWKATRGRSHMLGAPLSRAHDSLAAPQAQSA
jgi:membrane-associated phospholipid phosphatase